MDRKVNTPPSNPTAIVEWADGMTYQEWHRTLIESIRSNNRAEGAWRSIKNGGIEIEATLALQQYVLRISGAVRSDLSPMISEVVRLLKAAARAARIAEERKLGPDAPRYAQRAVVAMHRALSAPYPGPDGQKRTFAQALHENLALLSMSAEEQAHCFAQKNEAVRRENAKSFLAILRDYADKHGVDLSWGQVAALACCASSAGPTEDDMERSLRRWAFTPEVLVSRPQFLRGFEDWLASGKPPIWARDGFFPPPA